MSQHPFPENSREHASQSQRSRIGAPPAKREGTAHQDRGNADEQANGALLQAAQRVRESRQQLHDLIALAPSAYFLANRDGVLLEANPALCAISGYAPADLTGRNLTWLLPEGPRTPGDFVAMLPGIRTLRHRDGHAIPVRLYASVSRDASGAPDRMNCFLSQTDTGLQQNRAQELALHDALTGLPDRTLLNQRLQQLLEQAHGEPVALMFLDLDQFRKVNEALGHEAGDQLLRQVALRLRAMLPADGIVARLGGDEIAVPLHALAELEGVGLAVLADVPGFGGRRLEVGVDDTGRIADKAFHDDGDDRDLGRGPVQRRVQRADVAGGDGVGDALDIAFLGEDGARRKADRGDGGGGASDELTAIQRGQIGRAHI